MELLTVAQMARQSGVAATTLRYYDSLGLLEPVRMTNTHRRYPPESVDQVRIIKLCQTLGCDLGEIRILLQPDAAQARKMAAQRRIKQFDHQIKQLEAARTVLTHLLACDCTSYAECLAVTTQALASAPE